ncbi:flagellar assembly protein FliW [Paenibacillus nanensis]|uniref:Flagellar assembly factor FliW n=1 Tax=Paenibacillus nanensis TaxID=393251 RepID=A0A3A1UKT8_9BACL|nr:flagellar assembly protein FliW [Paenibacillus nanensis]RIX47298.1 flagellar assembly protein FliW [Paenibacillus nanensis]
MILETTRFGQYEYQAEDVLHFENGIPGFKDHREFLLIEDNESPFMYLQSIKDGGLAFIVVSPFDFFPEYEFELNDLIKSELDIKSESDLRILNIISVRDELASATINLAAPVVVNVRMKQGTQYILADGSYSIRQPLFSPIIGSRRA